WVYSVNYSPDGNYLASGSNDGTIKIWSIQTGKEIRTLRDGFKWINSVNYSPDGNYLASDSSQNIRIWNVDSNN
ncbi:MAG: protein kinase, partial [Gloeocapsa sp. DLM2.Bin57]